MNKIAAISDNHRVVWGVGETESDALADASRWMKKKGGLSGGAGKLRITRLKRTALPNIMDGDELYNHCESRTEKQEQMELL